MTAVGVLLGIGGLAMTCNAVIISLYMPDRPHQSYAPRSPEVLLNAPLVTVVSLLAGLLFQAMAKSRSVGGRPWGVGGGWGLITTALALLIGWSELPAEVDSGFPLLDTHLGSILLFEALVSLAAGVAVLVLLCRPAAREYHSG